MEKALDVTLNNLGVDYLGKVVFEFESMALGIAFLTDITYAFLFRLILDPLAGRVQTY